jgi:hypothetical protein
MRKGIAKRVEGGGKAGFEFTSKGEENWLFIDISPEE